MQIQPIKLSPKRNGKGYVSSYSVSISPKEAQVCGLTGDRVIKIVDPENKTITIKAKSYCVTDDILNRIYELHKATREEQASINTNYYADSRVRTMTELLINFVDKHDGRCVNNAEVLLENYLQSLPCEVIVDLVLLMYLGRDMDCDLMLEPGEVRFLDSYNYYSYIVHSKSKSDLIDQLVEKSPLSMYLKRGAYLLNLPAGTSLDTVTRRWEDM